MKTIYLIFNQEILYRNRIYTITNKYFYKLLIYNFQKKNKKMN